MTIKGLKCAYSAIWHAKEIIEQLACEDYPHTEFEDPDIREMFYTLNRMNITLSKKIDAAEAAARK